jgi:hypothetical protein
MNKKIAILIAVLFLGLFILWPLITVIESVKFKKNGVHTEGTVSDRDTHGKGLARVTVIFKTQDGSEVSAKAQKRNFVGTGDKTELWYDPADPQKIDFGDTIGYNMRVVIIVGLVIILMIYLLVKILLAESAKKKLLKSGTKISAEFVVIDRNEKYRMGEKNPWIIKCKWTDSRNNREYFFVSKDYTINPKDYLAGRRYIDVYIDPADPSKYYMDASFMPEGDITIG